MPLSPLDIERELRPIGEDLLDEVYQQTAYTIANRRKEKEELLSDPGKLDKVVSGELSSFLPTDKKIKKEKVNTYVEAADATIDSSHPFANLGKDIQSAFQKELSNPNNEAYTAAELMSKAKSNVLLTPDAEGKSRLEKAYEEKLHADHSLGRFIGLGKDLKALPGYDDWYKRKMAEPEEEGMGFGSLLTYMGMGAAGGAAFGTIGAGIGSVPGAVIGGIGGAASWGISKLIEGTEYAKAMEGTKELTAVDIGASIAGGIGVEALGGKILIKSLEAAVKAGTLSSASRELFSKTPALKTAIDAADATKLAEKIELDAKMLASHPDMRKFIFQNKAAQLRREAILEQNPTAMAKLEEMIPAIEYKGPISRSRPGVVAESASAAGQLKTTLEAEERIGLTGLSPSERAAEGELRNFLTGSSIHLYTNEGLMKAFQDLSEPGAEKVLQKATSSNDLFGSIRTVWQEEKIAREVAENEKLMKTAFTKSGSLEPADDIPSISTFFSNKVETAATKQTAAFDKARTEISKLLDKKSTIDFSATTGKEAKKAANWRSKMSKSLVDFMHSQGFTKALMPGAVGIVGGLAAIGLTASDADAASPQEFYKMAVAALESGGRKITPAVAKELEDRVFNVIPAEAIATVKSVKPFAEAATDYRAAYRNVSKLPDTITDESSNALFWGKGKTIYIRPSEEGFYALDHEVGHNVMDDMTEAAVSTIRRSYGNMSVGDVGELQTLLNVRLGTAEEMFAEGFRLKVQRPDLFDTIYPPEFQDHINYAVDELIAQGKMKFKDGGEVGSRTVLGGREEGRGLWEWKWSGEEGEGEKLFEEAYTGVMQASRSMSGSVSPGAVFNELEGVGAKVSSATAGVFKAVSEGVKSPVELMRNAKSLGLIAEEVKEGQKILPGLAQKALKVRDLIGKSPGEAWTFEDVSKVVGKTKSKLDWLASLSSPYTFLRWYGQEGHNLAVELASGQNAIQNNVINSLKVFNNILKDVKGVSKTNQEAINKVMKELSPQLDEVFVGARIADSEYGVQAKLAEKLAEAMGKKGADKELLGKKLEEVKNKMQMLSSWKEELKPKFAEANKKWETTIQALAQKFPETRISLAAEDTAAFEKYPWLKQLMQPSELEAVTFLKGMHQNYAERIVAAGEKVLSEPFVHHSTFRSEMSMKNLQERLTKMGIDPAKSIPYARFHHRGIFSRQMIPDIVRNMTDYIPDAEKRIVNADFWRVGKKDGWDYVTKTAIIKSSKPWREFFDRIKDAYLPQENSISNQIARNYTTLETIRLLTFAPSAAFKHLFKVQGTWATMGFGYSAKHIGESLQMAASAAAKESLNNRGLISKLGVKNVPMNELHDLGKSIIKQQYMLNALGDIEVLPVTRSVWEDALNKVSSVTGIGIKAVENFDRAHSYLAAVNMAANKGMTSQQAMYAIYDNILKNNFLGGALNPSWMRNPKIRALALFQNTPFKILERRLVNALKSGESIKTAWGVMHEQGISQSLKELADIKAYIREGEAEFKRNLIYDALKSEKDYFGTPVLTQTVKEMVVCGATIAGGAAIGLDFWPQTWHTPFLQVGAKTPTIAASPIVAATYGTMTGKGATAEGYSGEEESFGVASRFLRQWLGPQGVKPLIVHKMTRISEEDIPEIYKGSRWQYLFSVPSRKED